MSESKSAPAPLKEFVRVGNHFINLASIIRVDVRNVNPPNPVSVGVHYGHGQLQSPHIIEGDDAEVILDALGYGKDAREKEAKAAADAAEKEAKAAEKPAAKKVA